ncbi:hypothetical protein PsorP6_001388 [Peronosclerospora sorghi]|uniref:Uncharacterized protein n=1 Tax=Peronosclerospora sorghi TaxID=230839 RepID=A0ACC0WSR4_9STRA|nr:hypothetical protein PsorP6_001388 [Peronosclerospora sorghi]
MCRKEAPQMLINSKQKISAYREAHVVETAKRRKYNVIVKNELRMNGLQEKKRTLAKAEGKPAELQTKQQQGEEVAFGCCFKSSAWEAYRRKKYSVLQELKREQQLKQMAREL